MESATTIVSAIALGAAATLQPTITPAVKDAYDGLKSLIKRKYPNINVDRLEGSPESRARRIILEEDLENSGADKDEELISLSKIILELVDTKDIKDIGAHINNANTPSVKDDYNS